MLLVELSNEDIRNSKAYKKYYAIALGAAPPKTKASVRKTKSSSDTTITPPTAAGIRLSTLAKGKQPAKSSKAKGLTVLSEVAMIEAEQMKLAMKTSLQHTHISQASGSGADEGTGIILEVLDVPTDESDEEISRKSSDEDDDDDEVDERNTDNDDDDFVHPKLSIHEEEAKDEESFDPIVQTPENSDDEGNDDASLGLNVGSEEGHDAEDDDEELYRDVNINLEGREVQIIDVHTTQEFEDTHVTLTPVNHDGQQQSSSVSSQFVTSMLNPSPDAGIDSLFETTSRVDVQASTTVAPLTLTAPTFPPPTIPTTSQVPQAPTPPTTALSTFLQDLPNFGSLFRFDHRLKTLEANFFEFVQTNQFAGAVSSIPGIVERYMDQWMNEAIKEQVKEQVKVQVSKILPKIKKTVNENLYKALVDAYESDKIILDTYGDIVTLKRRRDDADKDEEPTAGSDRGFKRRREGKELESTSASKEKATKTTGKSTQGSKSHQKTTSESAPAEEPLQTTQDLEEPLHQEFETGAADDQPIAEASQHPECVLTKQADSRFSFNELMDTPVDFSVFLMNRLKVDTLTPKLLAGPTYELMKGSCKSLVGLEFFLEEVVVLSLLTTSSTTTSSIYVAVPPVNRSAMTNMLSGKSLIGGANINSSMDLQSTGSLLEMSTLNVELSLSPNFRSLNGMITSIWIGSRRVEDLQLGVKSYQKKLNLTKLDTYRTDLKCKEAYTAYFNPRGFICQNKDKQNRLMRIDGLHKFSDGTPNDV
nr:hypothetical protein [Tanacetum cinerariifolium]